MNETVKAIMERYSCRDFSAAPLGDDQVKTLTDAALASPSAMNRQPWHVIAVTNKALIEEMDAECMRIIEEQDKGWYERMTERGGKVFYNAPFMLLAASDGSDYAALDCGILSQNVSLAAHAIGLGSVICGMAGIPLGGPRGAGFKERLGFPDGYGFGIAVLAGTANSGKDPHGLDYAKVTYVK